MHRTPRSYSSPTIPNDDDAPISIVIHHNASEQSAWMADVLHQIGDLGQRIIEVRDELRALRGALDAGLDELHAAASQE